MQTTVDRPLPERVFMRDAEERDISAMQSFIFEHGPNEWNYLPEGLVKEHLAAIASGKTRAVTAWLRGELAGFVTFEVGDFYPQYEPASRRAEPRGYVGEAVVRRDLAGQGLGARLLEEAKQRLHAMGVDTIYIHRHADNLASGGMMRKAGFKEVDAFFDPEHRGTGSRMTSVSRFRYEDAGG